MYNCVQYKHLLIKLMGIIATDNLLAFNHLHSLFPFVPKMLEIWSVTSAAYFFQSIRKSCADLFSLLVGSVEFEM